MVLDPKDREHFDSRCEAAARALAARAPVPARVGNILVGSASWTDPSLVKSGLFYPPEARSAEKRLRYYATRFSMVEVDSSYYALPTAAQAHAWVARTPDGFRFNVKAFAAMTGHPVDLRRLPKDLKAQLPPQLAGRRKARAEELPAFVRAACWSWFCAAIEPLRRAGRLGCVLLQFPPWLRATRGAARELVACRDRLGDLPLAVEFRHRSWLDASRWDRVQSLLRDQGLTFVGVDAPRGFETGLPPRTAVTHPSLAMVRFHGRNRATWGGAATAAERFDYLYSERELREWLPSIRSLSDGAEEVHVVMNNCAYDAAQLSGYGIAALLQEVGPRRAKRAQEDQGTELRESP